MGVAERSSGYSPRVVRAIRLAKLLDARFLDPVLGALLPEIGDWLGVLLGLYPVYVAYREGLSARILAQMLWNLGLDLLVGAVPALGDILDFAFKANMRNTALLEAALRGEIAAHESTTPGLTLSGRTLLLGAGFFFVGAVVLSAWIGSIILTSLWHIIMTVGA